MERKLGVGLHTMRIRSDATSHNPSGKVVIANAFIFIPIEPSWWPFLDEHAARSTRVFSSGALQPVRVFNVNRCASMKAGWLGKQGRNMSRRFCAHGFSTPRLFLLLSFQNHHRSPPTPGINRTANDHNIVVYKTDALRGAHKSKQKTHSTDYSAIEIDTKSKSKYPETFRFLSVLRQTVFGLLAPTVCP